MNAEALIGKVLGTCTLQKLIGRGGMGAVFLAQQSRPRRQVAVKVLLPTTRLNANQQVAFLERFRRETDAAASLEHPNILPVHEYGERDGLAYLVMPYVSGGTLRDELEREGQLPLVRVVNYLDQLAAALDVAHEHGVIHRDIKPANILMTPEGRLLLTDFGLVKVITDGQMPQVSITGAGVPLGTPDYMSPEQIVGGTVDARTDLYSLGIVLYQMITGRTPFRGDMPMQVAMHHLNSEPPLPSSLRQDLPIPAEQVILRMLAKNPDERYMSAQDFTSAFRLALAVSGVQLTIQNVGGGDSIAPEAESRLYTLRGLFDPSWQTGNMPVVQQKPKGGVGLSRVSTPALVPITPRPDTLPVESQNAIVAQTSMTLPSFSELLSPTNTASGADIHNTTVANNPYTPLSYPPDMLPGSFNAETGAARVQNTDTSAHTNMKPRSVHKTGLLRATDNGDVPSSQMPHTSLSFSPSPPNIPSTSSAGNAPTSMTSFNPVSPFPTSGANGTLGNSASLAGRQSNEGTMPSGSSYPGQGATTTMKLTQSFKVIQVPVAGQPGQFVTGFLPVLPQEQAGASSSATSTLPPSNLEPLLSGRPLHVFNKLKKNVNAIVPVAAVLLVLLASSTFWLMRTHTNTSRLTSTLATPNVMATAGAQATATMQANIILSDSLSTNSHNWHVATSGLQQYVFKDNAYHIINNDTKALALALLPDETLSGSYVYSLTMEAISGDESAITNQFGLVYCFSVHQKNGKTYKSFYIFEVANKKGGSYQLLKYDDTGDPSSPWETLWSAPYGKEFHAGHGPGSVNTFKVAVNENKFTLIVNDKVVGKTQDSTLKSGLVGMLVNLDKTEVAFSKLLLTYT
ncbi:MAG: hypothetical protein NVSMB49_03510 [Ktedonobacteraceae bacterium]